MRRFLAYITMLLTMVCALIFNTQAVLDVKTDAMEYGSGTEMVYSLSKREKSDYNLDKMTNLNENDPEELQNIDIEGVIMDRLDLAGVRNANVRIVQGNSDTQEGYQLRISLSPLNESELNRVKEVISITGSLSMGTIGDDTVMYADGGELFDYSSSGDFSTIVYNGNTPYPTIRLDKEDYETLKTAASEASDAHKNDTTTSEANRIMYADGDEEESSDSTTVYLWTNKMKEDTYDKAFGTNDTIVQDEVKAKVIAKLDLNNWDSDNCRLSITSDIDGNAFDISSARAFMNMLNADDYGFNLEFLYQNSVPASFGADSKGLKITYIVCGVILALIVALLIIFFGIAGISASLTMLGSILVSFYLFSVLGFEFSVAALVALFVLLIQSLLISLNYFERVKIELKKDRGLDKANREGYHKSFFTAFDFSLALLLSSLFCFLIAVGSYKTFFGVIMIGSIFTFIITNYINKWMMYWLCKDITDSGKISLFGKVSKKETKAINFIKKEKHGNSKLSYIIPIIACVCLAIALPVSYLLSSNSSFFNNNGDFSNSYVLNIQFSGENESYDTLSDKDSFITYLTNIGTDSENVNNGEGYVMYEEGSKIDNSSTASFSYDPDSVFINFEEKKDEDGNTYFIHYYTLNVSANLNDVLTTNQNNVLAVIQNTIINKEILIDEETSTYVAPVVGYSHYKDDTLEVGSYVSKATNVSHNYLSMFLLVFLISIFASCYILVRYGINIALTNLVSGTLLSVVGIVLLVSTRIPFTSFTGFGLLALVLLNNMFNIIVLGGNKEILKEEGIKYTASDEQRSEIANTIANRSIWIIVPSIAVSLIFGVSLILINTALIGLSISIVLFSIITLIGLYSYSLPLYYSFATHIYFGKLKEKLDAYREKKGKKIEYSYKDGIKYVDDGPHETIVPGLNDFIVRK